MEPARVWRLFVQTFDAWSSDKVPRHGAALAYYTVLSLVPLLVVIIGMIGLIFGQEAAQGYIVEQIAALVGPQSAATIKDMIQRANQPTTGIDFHGPFGGAKASGSGPKEQGKAAADFYTSTQTIAMAAKP